MSGSLLPPCGCKQKGFVRETRTKPSAEVYLLLSYICQALTPIWSPALPGVPLPPPPGGTGVEFS